MCILRPVLWIRIDLFRILPNVRVRKMYKTGLQHDFQSFSKLSEGDFYD